MRHITGRKLSRNVGYLAERLPHIKLLDHHVENNS